jgi:hypothetical protein
VVSGCSVDQSLSEPIYNTLRVITYHSRSCDLVLVLGNDSASLFTPAMPTRTSGRKPLGKPECAYSSPLFLQRMISARPEPRNSHSKELRELGRAISVHTLSG